MISLDQTRARHAYAVIAHAKDQRWAADFRRVVMDLPVQVFSNGLVQAVVFAQGKQRDKEHVKELLSALADWCTRRNGAPQRLDLNQVRDWVHRLVGADFNILSLQTEEAIAYTGWLKRFAEAELPKLSTQGGTT